MKKTIVCICGLLFLCIKCPAQEKWSFQQCIDYALQNNVSIKKAEFNSQLSELDLNTAKNSRLPSVSGSLGHTNYFGRGPSRDGTYQDNNQMSTSGGISGSNDNFQRNAYKTPDQKSGSRFRGGIGRPSESKERCNIEYYGLLPASSPIQGVGSNSCFPGRTEPLAGEQKSAIRR